MIALLKDPPLPTKYCCTLTKKHTKDELGHKKYCKTILALISANCNNNNLNLNGSKNTGE
jgi:hypothetical protein